MPVDYRYNAEERFIEVKCSGHLVIKEISGYFEEIAADPSIKTDAIELVDLTEVTHFDVDFAQAATMPAGYIPAHEKKRIRATILFGATKLNLGLAQLIRAHFRLTMPHHHFDVVVFQRQAWEEGRRLRQLIERGSA